jgi:hypothetical protein
MEGSKRARRGNWRRGRNTPPSRCILRPLRTLLRQERSRSCGKPRHRLMSPRRTARQSRTACRSYRTRMRAPVSSRRTEWPLWPLVRFVRPSQPMLADIPFQSPPTPKSKLGQCHRLHSATGSLAGLRGKQKLGNPRTGPRSRGATKGVRVNEPKRTRSTGEDIGDADDDAAEGLARRARALAQRPMPLSGPVRTTSLPLASRVIATNWPSKARSAGVERKTTKRSPSDTTA